MTLTLQSSVRIIPILSISHEKDRIRFRLKSKCYTYMNILRQYNEVEVYRALLSIALIHVQVMLNFCTTLVSSATRAKFKRGKKNKKLFKCFNFRGTNGPWHESASKNNITTSAARVQNTERLNKTMSCLLGYIFIYRVGSHVIGSRAYVFIEVSANTVQQLRCAASRNSIWIILQILQNAHGYDTKTFAIIFQLSLNASEKIHFIRVANPQVKDVFELLWSEHTVTEYILGQMYPDFGLSLPVQIE